MGLFWRNMAHYFAVRGGGGGGLRGDTDTDRLPLSIQPQGHNSYIFSTEAEISIFATSFLQSQHSPASPTGFYN